MRSLPGGLFYTESFIIISILKTFNDGLNKACFFLLRLKRDDLLIKYEKK